MRWPSLSIALMVLVGIAPLNAYGYGAAGKRFFPATLAVDDPFFIDELDLLLRHQPDADRDGAQVDTTGATLKYSKRITDRLTLSLGTGHTYLNPVQGATRNGFDNMSVGVNLMGPISPERESVVAIGLDANIGGTGSEAVNGQSFSVVSPAFYLGQGFGNLPETVKYLRPLAFTTAIAYNLPTRGSKPETLSSGFTLQYNLAYLSSFVADGGLPAWLSHAVPLIEAPLQFCLDEGCGEMTGTINPGVIWFNRLGQISLEAAIPVNNRSGDSVGMFLQLHLYMDAVFPNSLGKPIFD